MTNKEGLRPLRRRDRHRSSTLVGQAVAPVPRPGAQFLTLSSRLRDLDSHRQRSVRSVTTTTPTLSANCCQIGNCWANAGWLGVGPASRQWAAIPPSRHPVEVPNCGPHAHSAHQAPKLQSSKAPKLQGPRRHLMSGFRLYVRQGLLRVVGVALEFGRAAVPYLAPRHQVSKASLRVNRCYGPVNPRYKNPPKSGGFCGPIWAKCKIRHKGCGFPP